MNEPLRECALFAGAGGGILGGILLGWRTVCAVELDPYCQRILAQRQNDGILEPFPIYSDIREFDGREWAGSVDVVSGGFPCTDISTAGKGAGITGSESGLWKEMARIIGEVRPRFVFVENSPALTSRGLGTVLGDLAALGFDTEHGVVGAHHVGAPHKRDRIWILASHPDRSDNGRIRGGLTEHGTEQGPCGDQPNGLGTRGRGQGQAESEVADAMRDGNGRRPAEAIQAHGGSLWANGLRGSHEAIDRCEGMADANRSQRERDECTQRGRSEHTHLGGAGWWESEPDVGRVAHGVASRMDRLKAIGNGQVPACAALAFRTLYRRLME